jgi:hypothetical protein
VLVSGYLWHVCYAPFSQLIFYSYLWFDYLWAVFFSIGIADSVPTYKSITAHKAILAMVMIWQFFFNASINTTSYLVAIELVSSCLRAWTVGSGMLIGFVIAWLTSFCTLYFINPTALNLVSELSLYTMFCSNH